jgi:hypothetical protein
MFTAVSVLLRLLTLRVGRRRIFALFDGISGHAKSIFLRSPPGFSAKFDCSTGLKHPSRQRQFTFPHRFAEITPKMTSRSARKLQ